MADRWRSLRRGSPEGGWPIGRAEVDRHPFGAPAIGDDAELSGAAIRATMSTLSARNHRARRVR